ncbi:TetR/AcrR family transcriptional regulator [Actinoplanes sp. NPDC020271]|uniref:TetR/AcrR family transcriptional regulator n=1 Tax=Actinoplanes sp. NPDC020271 TaxID=3363896 RepID=UPI0037B8891F
MPDVKHFDPDAVLDIVVRLFWQRGMASTGVQDIVDATGIARSSLYATFGGKGELFRAALSRYVELSSAPAFSRLTDDRGLPAVREFFDRLIDARCHGQYARWGCMVSNTHAGGEADDPQVQEILDRHHRELRAAMRTALTSAERHGQLAATVHPDEAADVLALLAYGVNLRSRAGVDAQALRATVAGSLRLIGG